MCIWIIRDILGQRLTKDGVGWIVDLKISKKLKRKWKKRWVLPSCGFEINKECKGKAKKKDWCWTKLCKWRVRDLLCETEKKMGLAELWIWK